MKKIKIPRSLSVWAVTMMFHNRGGTSITSFNFQKIAVGNARCVNSANEQLNKGMEIIFN